MDIAQAKAILWEKRTNESEERIQKIIDFLKAIASTVIESHPRENEG